MTRTEKENVFIWDYGDVFFIVCPVCGKCAAVQSVSPKGKAGMRLVCAHCGHVKDWARQSCGIMYANNVDSFRAGEVSIGAAVDWYFHEPLWLQAPCCGHMLWAYNPEHLDWLRSFVAARLRERVVDEKHGWSNQAMASRLPRWIKLASNRDEVLNAIDRLKIRYKDCLEEPKRTK